MKYEELTKQVIGCAFEVHRILGNGFQEVIYQRALVCEFENLGLHYEREKEFPVLYKGLEIGSRRADFYIDDKVIVELKALTKIEDVHLAQIMNYLEAFQKEIGLLINFGNKSLQFKRIHNNKL